MKKIFLLSLIFTCLNLFSQENENNFILNEDKTVYWQKVFTLEGTQIELKEMLQTFFKNQKFTSDLVLKNNEFTGKSTKTNVRVKRGESYINSLDFTCFIIVDIKDNKYRVTINEIIFEPVTGGINTGGIIITSNQSYSFGDFTVRDNKNEFRKNNAIQEMIKAFDHDFIKYFTYTKPDKSNEW